MPSSISLSSPSSSSSSSSSSSFSLPCNQSLRLTSSFSSQRSAVWSSSKQQVLLEFETQFSFRFRGQSKICESRIEKDQLATLQYRVCSDEALLSLQNSTSSSSSSSSSSPFSDYLFNGYGGDGFAFVLHNSVSGSRAIGSFGSGLGYSGIDNSIAIEFDTFSNVGEMQDPTTPHISIHGNGINNNGGVNDASSSSLLSANVDVIEMMDGGIHIAKIALYPVLRKDYLQQGRFSGSSLLTQFIHEILSTLCVFIDDLTQPKLCVPLDLHSLINLDSGSAFVGLTAATGLHYQQTDILKWRFCSKTGNCDL